MVIELFEINMLNKLCAACVSFAIKCVSISEWHLVVGFGVEQLRDGSLDTYWQSDGPQPHLINIQFRRKMTISDICIYADYKADESYTPNRSVRHNNSTETD